MCNKQHGLSCYARSQALLGLTAFHCLKGQGNILGFPNISGERCLTPLQKEAMPTEWTFFAKHMQAGMDFFESIDDGQLARYQKSDANVRSLVCKLCWFHDLDCLRICLRGSLWSTGGRKWRTNWSRHWCWVTQWFRWELKCFYLDVEPKIGGFSTPKWMLYFMENLIKMDDLGVPLFLETPIWSCGNLPFDQATLMSLVVWFCLIMTRWQAEP